MDQRTSSLDNAIAWAAIGLAAFTLPAASGCLPATPAPGGRAAAGARLDTDLRAETETARLNQIVDVGNGVYTFPADKQFPETLSDFRGAHPELKIVTVTQGTDVRYGFGNGAWGRSNSFVVVTEAETAQK